jgi:hypothetical protein
MVHSGLSRSFTLEGITVDVQIYRFADEGEWVLVVVDKSGGGTVWDKVFATDTEAMGAFLAVAEEEGLADFSGEKGAETLH